MEEEKIKRKDDPRILRLRKELYRKIRATAKKEKLPFSALAYLIKANANMGTIFNKNTDTSLYTILSIMNVLGYEVSFTRNDNPFNWKEDKILKQRYEKFKYDRRAAKRKARGLPPEDFISVRTKGKRASDRKIVIISRRSIKDLQEQKNDIFSTPGGGNEVSRSDVERRD